MEPESKKAKTELNKSLLHLISASPRKDAILLLLDLQICPYCVLRFLDISSVALYQLPPQVLCGVLEQVAGRAFAAHERCLACLGILPALHTQAFTDNLLAELTSYTFLDFAYSLYTPPSIHIRQYGTYYHLQERLGTATFPDEVVPRVTEVKEVMRWVLTPLLEGKLGRPMVHDSKFKVMLDWIHPETADDHRWMPAALGENKGPKPPKNKHQHGRAQPKPASNASVTRMLHHMGRASFVQHGPCPPAAVSTIAMCQVGFEHASVFVYGRYRKLVRGVSQSRWIVEGKRQAQHSVEELVGSVLLQTFGAKEHRFHSAGREDADVLMLGSGRPFMMELVDPHNAYLSPDEVRVLEGRVNASTDMVAVSELRMADKAEMPALLKVSEYEKSKTYRCVVWVERVVTQSELDALNAIQDLTLDQQTPVRVMHRRANLTRQKAVHSIHATVSDRPHYLTVDLETQAGTYVKEFVHGDLGRTRPSFAQLIGCDADITQLDVLGVAT